MRWIQKIFFGIVTFFFASTLLAVVAYKFLPVVITPLMVIRAVENVKDGESPVWHHTWESMDDISPEMPRAVIASEDQRFFQHHGFDFEAIKTAQKLNKEAGRNKFGASTITQQTAKNVFLWPGRSWMRKGLEAYFTVLIEFVWGKERILEVYLNSIEMGKDIYGVEAVAEENFGKEAIDLTKRECALIAATLPNPREYSSKDPSSYMRKRQRAILKQMRYVSLP